MKNYRKLFIIPMTLAALSLPAIADTDTAAIDNEAARARGESVENMHDTSMRTGTVVEEHSDQDHRISDSEPATAAVGNQEMDVEELLDDRAKFNGQEVTIHGEVEKVIDNRTFILESGGFFNDEVTVVLDKALDAEQMAKLVQEDQQLIVTGKFNNASINGIESEQNLSFGEKVKKSLGKADAYILGSDVRTQLSE